MYKNLYLKKGKEESLERFHPWIFPEPSII